MKKSIILLLTLFFVSFYSGNLTSKSNSQSNNPVLETSSNKIKETTVEDMMQKLPLYFVENKGQIDERVQYHLKLSGMNAYFTSQEIVYQLFQREEEEARVDNIRMKYVGMNEGVEVVGGEESEAKVNYFIGDDQERWVSGARTYEKVIYRELYPNIDLVVYGERGKLKHEYRVRAGGEVEDIRIKYEGVEELRENEEGELDVKLEGGELREGVPISYQRINGERVEVESGYKVMEDNVIGFRVGEYKKDRELIIDPELTYSTYLGGISNDSGRPIAIDGSGNAYVSGFTSSVDFPTTGGDTTHNGSNDVFITKLNSTGSALIYSTYLGGSNSDLCFGLAIDGSGNAYVTGETSSTDFPTTFSAYDTSHNGEGDVFITKLNSTGSVLSYSTYLGGDVADRAIRIAIDGSGNAYVTGIADSTNFPTTWGAFDTDHNGNGDTFVTKLNSTGSAVTYSTFLGGGEDDKGYGIAIDGSGNAYVTGYTYSTDFPKTPGVFDKGHNGSSDVFITKLNSTGSALSYSTFLGGSGYDGSDGLTIDGSGNAYVTGQTSSTDFPTTSGAYNTSYNGGTSDAFITKLNSTGSALSYSTYLGGSSNEFCWGIAIDGSGNAYVSGQTRSTDFPTTSGAYNTSYNGGTSDAFIAKLNSTGSALSYSTYLGGSDVDYGYEIAIDGSGNAYVTGDTESSDFPTTSGVFDTSHNGSYDVFVTKLFLGIGIRDDLLGTWSSGVWYRDAETGLWIKISTAADPIAAGDLDGDGLADLLGVWTGGLWVKYSANGSWKRLSSPPLPTAIACGDFNGDGRDDVVGSWPSGTFYRDTLGSSWVYVSSPADALAAGDLNGDGTDDIIGVWSNGLWVKYSVSGAWTRLSTPLPTDIVCGDMNGDGRDDVLGTWTSGTFYWDTLGGSWVYVSTSAVLVGAGDLDGDGTDDLMGTWTGAYVGLWIKYSATMSWKKISLSLPNDIDAGLFKGGTWDAGAVGYFEPVGGYAEGPGNLSEYEDSSDEGPGGWNFVYQEDANLEPYMSEVEEIKRLPGPGEPGFTYQEQKNLVPREVIERKKKE